MTVCHHAQITTLLATFGFGHILWYAPLSLSLIILYFRDSDAHERGCVKNEF